MRYSKQISTGLIIESQSGGDPANPAHLQTLKDNAIGQGIPEADIEVGYCTDAESETMLSARQTAQDLADPLGKWKRDIKQSDSSMLPRYLEDHIRDDHGGVAGNAQLQAKYDAKVALRNTKPS